MMHKFFQLSVTVLAVLATVALPAYSIAAVSANTDFTLSKNPNPLAWTPFNGACLTAGDGTGTIPACRNLAYYHNQVQIGGSLGFLGSATNPGTGLNQTGDADQAGALRLTNSYDQAGSIISNTPFPTGAGVTVVFKTITYLGNSGGAGGDGADGMSFFLMDGGSSSAPHAPYDTGAFGGSLGYTCANNNNDNTTRSDGTVRGYDGLRYGYIGLGIDEYGNFLNPGDNTATGPGYQPGRIGLRGPGSVSFAGLNALDSTKYPSILPYIYDPTYGSAARSAVHNTCRTGYLWDYSTYPLNVHQTSTAVADYAPIGTPIILSAIPSLAGTKIANEGALTRGAATPITYSLKITSDGLLSLNVAYGNGATYIPIITKQQINATSVLPENFLFGFAGSTGGSTNVHEILCFQAAPNDVAATSVGINEQEATKIAAGTQAYLAYYYPGDWTGRLTANDLVYTSSGSSQSISISATTNWDAQCNLTGVPTGAKCLTTGAGPSGPQIPVGSRTMLTWNGSQGVAFRWNNSPSGSSITSAQQSTLDAGDPAPINYSRLTFLRGDRSNEINITGTSGIYRPRDGILGDIVDASPTWVGPPTTHYSAQWKDLLVSGDPTPENSGSQSFSQFLTAMQTRQNVVYAGANDGFMHGFRTGSFDTNGNYVNGGSTPNDGQEVLAYMPSTVLNTIHNPTDGTLDYSGSQYSHNFYVDATPEADDVFYNGSWHTWLVGGQGAGGSAIYMLDVTNPNAANFSESNASNIVMGEWSSTTIGCSNVSGCGNNLGNTYGTPIVRRMHNGRWAVIFGNGFGSASYDGGIYIMLIGSNGSTQASDTYYLSTGVAGTAANPNGIAYVSSADLDGDHIVDYLYAGDLQGNVWRFDVTSGNAGTWAVSGAPLFTTGAGQPITTKVEVVGVPQGTGPQRLLVDFGTGRKYPPTVLAGTTYQPGNQDLYGVWDWNLANWNSMSSVKYSTLGTAPGTLTSTNLQTQTLTPHGTALANNLTYDISTNVVCWSGSTTCGSGNNKFGFAIALPGTQEQMVFNPLIYQNALIVNTTIPAVNLPSSCAVSHDTGYTLSVSLITGGSLSTPGKNFYLNTTDTNTAGSLTNGTGTPFVAQAGSSTFILTQSLGGASFSYAAGTTPPSGSPISCVTGSKICGGQIQAAATTSKRLTWIQRR